MKAEPSRNAGGSRYRPGYGVLAAHLVVGGALLAGVAWAATTWGVGVGFVVVLPALGLSFLFRPRYLGFITAVASLGAGAAGWEWGEADALERADVDAPIPVSHAPEQPGARVFQFSDGRVRADLREWSSEAARKGLLTHRFVAPIVPDGWRVDDPVPVWVVCSEPGPRRLDAVDVEPPSTHCIPSWEVGEPRVAVVVGDEDDSEADAWRVLIDAAEGRHGLHSHEHAPAVQLAASPADEAERLRSASKSTLAWTFGLWFVLLPAAWVAERVPRRVS